MATLNMIFNNVQIQPSLKSYEEIVAMDGTTQLLDELNLYPSQYFDYFDWLWKMKTSTNDRYGSIVILYWPNYSSPWSWWILTNDWYYFLKKASSSNDVIYYKDWVWYWNWMTVAIQ